MPYRVLCLGLFFLSGLSRASDSVQVAVDYELLNEQYRAAYFQLRERHSSKFLPEKIESLIGLDSLKSASELIESASSLNSTERTFLQNFIAAKSDYEGYDATYRITASYTPLHLKSSILQATWLYDNRFYDSAWAFIEYGEKIAAEIQLTHTLAYVRLLKLKGNLNYRKGDYEEAIKSYETGLAICQSNPFGNPLLEKTLYDNIAYMYTELWDYDLAMLNYEKALAFIYNGVYDSTSIHDTYNNLGLFYQRFNNLIQSKMAYEKAISYISPSREKYSYYSYNNYANLLNEIHAYAEAYQYYQKALACQESGTHPNNFYPYLNLAISFHSTFRKLKDEQYLIKSRFYLDSAQSVLQNAFNLSDIEYYHYLKEKGYQQLYDKQFIASRNSFERALELLQNYFPKDFYKIVAVRRGLSILAFQEGDYQQSLDIGKTNYSDLKENVEEQLLDKVSELVGIGENYEKLKQFDSAEHYFNLALVENRISYPDIVEDTTGLPGYMDNYLVLSCLLGKSATAYERFTEGETDLTQSQLFIEQAMEIIDNEKEKISNDMDQITYANSATEVYDQAFKVYFAKYRTTGETGYLDRLLYVSEKIKSQTLLSILNQQRIRDFQNVTNVLLRKEEELRLREEQLFTQITEELTYGDYANPNLLAEYRSAIDHSQEEYQLLIDSIEASFPSLHNLKFNRTTVSIEQIRGELLDDGIALIEFTFIEDSLFALFISKNTSDVNQIPLRSKSDIIGIRNLITIGQKDRYKAASRSIYDLLINPFEQQLNQDKISQIIFITDGFLSYLPFETLMNDKNEFLIENFDISYSYSATLLWQQQNLERKAPEKRRFLGVAPSFTLSDDENKDLPGNRSLASLSDERISYNDMKFEPLEFTTVEVKNIADYVDRKKANATILIGKQADESGLKNLPMLDYSIVHFASHSFPNYNNPRYSGIALTQNVSTAEDDILFADEIYHMRLNAELVTLSACETGLGKIFKAEGIIGLTRGFLHAGAKNLVVSLWKVDDRSSALFMTDFYRNYFKTNSLTKSLRKTKLKLLKSEEFNHPFYWAPFVLLGL
jgi:CHAT domain-containing protein/tetratricopeptide (TPR) repeat protein